MKANANQIRAAIDAAKPDIRLFLLHGPDEAGAQELGARLARAMGPEAERVDLEPSLLKANPGRLADEAASLSLFGSARHIRITGAGEECLEAFTLLLDSERAGNPVVAIAPSLKASAKLVKLALAAPRAMAFACYVPEGAEANQIVATIARELGMRTTGDTAARLAAATGGDRAIMTRELEKVALFLDAAPDRPREIDDAAIDAIGADIGDAEMGRAIDAAIDGKPDVLGMELARLDEAGTSAIPVLRQLTRRLMTLADLRAQIDAGGGPHPGDRRRVLSRTRDHRARAAPLAKRYVEFGDRACAAGGARHDGLGERGTGAGASGNADRGADGGAPALIVGPTNGEIDAAGSEGQNDRRIRAMQG